MKPADGHRRAPRLPPRLRHAELLGGDRLLNVTQSTVSHQIARIEEHLGKQLFERTTRSCRFSAEGREVILLAVRILRSVEEREQNFRPQLMTDTVAIGVPDDYHLFDVITAAPRGFMRDKPGVAVEMRAGLAVNHLRDLRAGNLNRALVRDVEEGTGEALRTDPMVWIAAEGRTSPFDGVIPLAAVDGGCAYRKAAIAALERKGMPWKCQFSCTSLEGVLSVVRAGLAVSVVIDGAARQGGAGWAGTAFCPVSRRPP